MHTLPPVLFVAVYRGLRELPCLNHQQHAAIEFTFVGFSEDIANFSIQ